MAIIWSAGLGQNLYKNISAEKVYNEIVSIGDSATPEQIVERAKDKKSELHKCFTWDDTEAANKWRKQEARLIRSFLVIQNDSKPDATPIHALHFTASGEGYKTAELVFRNQDEYEKLLQNAYADLQAFSKKYQTLKDDLGEILELIEQLV